MMSMLYSLCIFVSLGQFNMDFKNDESPVLLSTPLYVYSLCLLAAIGGFLFGYDTGVISGAMLIIKDVFNLHTIWQELIVAIAIGGAALFSLFGGFFNDWLGRRIVIILSSAVFTVGAILLGAAQGKEMLLVGRFIVGAGIGLASMTVPMYIAETAPAHLRGRLVTVNNLFITAGQFIASVLDGAFSYVDGGWRAMLGLAAVPSIIQLVAFFFLPESPRWLVEHGNRDAALRVLIKLRGSRHLAEQELRQIQQTHEDAEREREQHGGRFVLLTMLRAPHLRRALIVGCGLQLFQQLSGINTVMYYSATIIAMSGLSKDRTFDIWLSAVTAGVNFVCTFIGIYLVERVGRRILTLMSLAGVILSLLLLGIGFQLAANNSPAIVIHSGQAPCANFDTCNDCISNTGCGYCFYENLKASNYNGTCLPVQDADHTDVSTAPPCNRTLSTTESLTWAYSWCPTQYSFIPVVGLVLYLFFFAPGMGPMPWTINSEIYPQWARSTGNSMATATNWIFNLIVSMTFLSLLEAIGKQGAYYLYAAIAFLGLVFFCFVLPETKGRTLEEVESLFALPWWNRAQRGRFADYSSTVKYVHIRGYNRDLFDDDSD